MASLKDYGPRILTGLAILIFLVALFYAIHSHIDGFGIFSIVAAVIFFSFLFYELSKKHTAVNGSLCHDVPSNMSHFLRIVTSPMFVQLLPRLATLIFSYLERHKDKLDREQTKKLQEDLQIILSKFNFAAEDKLADVSEPSTDKHKKI